MFVLVSSKRSQTEFVCSSEALSIPFLARAGVKQWNKDQAVKGIVRYPPKNVTRNPFLVVNVTGPNQPHISSEKSIGRNFRDVGLINK